MKLVKYVGMIMAALALFVVTGCDDDDDPSAFLLRVIHASYDAPAVDVAVNGGTPIQNLSYGESSGYAQFDAGTLHIRVRPAGATEPDVIAADLEFEAGMDYTIFATDALAAIAPVLSTDERDVVGDKAKVRLLHASPDAPAVDVKVGSATGPAVFSNVAFQEITDYVEVDPDTYTLVVTAAGDETAVVTFAPQALAAGGVYTVVAIGTLDASDDAPFIVRVFVDTGDGITSLDLVPAV
jgi:hypothetical protein